MDATEMMYVDLSPLLQNLAKRAAPSMGEDWEDVFSELLEELVKCCKKYSEKMGDELKRLIVQSCKNRIYELRSRNLTTHRSAEQTMLSLEAGEQDEDGDGAHCKYRNIQPAVQDFYMIEVLDCMGNDARAMMEEILNPSPRALFHFSLQEHRKRSTALRGMECHYLNAEVMASAMGWSYSRTKAAWQEIYSVLRQG